MPSDTLGGLSASLASHPARQKLTPPAIARLYGIDPAKVVGWINAGELIATNVATRANGGRPRWVVDVEDLRDFERRRSNVKASKPALRKRRAATATEVSYY